MRLPCSSHPVSSSSGHFHASGQSSGAQLGVSTPTAQHAASMVDVAAPPLRGVVGSGAGSISPTHAPSEVIARLAIDVASALVRRCLESDILPRSFLGSDPGEGDTGNRERRAGDRSSPRRARSPTGWTNRTPSSGRRWPFDRTRSRAGATTMSRARLSKAGSAMVATCLAVTSACNHEAPEPTTEIDPDEDASGAATGELQAPVDPQAYDGCGGFVPIDPGKFEFIPIELIEDIFVHRLPEPTPLGEDVVIHVRFPELGDPSPQPSLVRVLGVKDSPVLMFDSDALAELGHIPKSPGAGFFATFAKSDELGLERRKELENLVLEKEKISDLSFVIEGRHPIAVSTAQPFALDAFLQGDLVGLGRIRITPQSIDQNWLESVFITDPAVVQDPERTYDTCTQEGDACGPWTFCHLMTEMANTSRTGITPEEFTRQWLEQWLDDYP